jgi:hypothetical protein
MLTPLQYLPNFLEYVRQGLEHGFVSEPQHRKTSLQQVLISNRVVLFSFWRVVNSAVQFNHHSSFDRAKIDDVTINRLLALEFNAIKWIAPQSVPKRSLGRRRGLPIGSSQLGEVRAGHRLWLYLVSRVRAGQNAFVVDAAQTLSPLFSLRSKRPLPRAVAGEGFGERAARTPSNKSVRVHAVSRTTP